MKLRLPVLLAAWCLLFSLPLKAQDLFVTWRVPGVGSVLRYDSVTGAYLGSFVSAGSGGLTRPTGLTFGPDGNLYVADRNQVLRYDGVTGAFSGAFATAPPLSLDNPADIAFGPNGDLYVSDIDRGISRFDGATGAFLGQLVPTGPNLRSPYGLAFGPDNSLFVGSATFGSIQRFDATTGDFLGIFTSGRVAQGIDLEFGPDGNLYASGGSGIQRFNGTTGVYIDTLAAGASAFGLAFGPSDGNLYFNDLRSIQRYNLSTRTVETLVPPIGNGTVIYLKFRNAIPEPGTWTLVVCGLFFFAGVARSSRHRTRSAPVRYTEAR